MLRRLMSLLMSLFIAAGSVTVVFAEEGSQEVLFIDDFSQGSSNWTAVDGTSYGYNTARGILEFYGSDEDEVNIIGGGVKWKDYYETVKFTPSNIGYFGFYIRYKNEDNHVVAKIYGREGKLKLLQKSGGGNYQLIKNIKYIFSDNTEYELGLRIYGNRLEVYINGELIGQTDKISIKEGGIGFNSLESSACIDNVKVSTVEEKYDNPEVGDVSNIYVSPTGDDLGDGSVEHPLRTFEAARQLANIRKIGNTPVNVIFKEGIYEFSETIKLTSVDSGTESAPVKYMAEPGKKVIFTGAKKLDVNKFKPVSGIASERVNKKAEGKLVQYDLSATGLDESIYAMETNAKMLYPYYPPSIFLNDKLQELSRWPNDGWNYFGEVIDSGGTAQSTWSGEKTVAQVQNQGAVFKYDQLNPSFWKSVDGAYIMGFFGTEYRNEWAKLSNIDQSNQTISLAHYTSYGVKPNHRWAIVNLLDEIDMPGEWCIDKEKHMLYYWPTHTLTNKDTIEITGMTAELLNITGAENIVMDGICFEKSRADGLILENCNNITINGCEIKDFVYNAMQLKYCSNINITDNNIRNTGRAGIRLYRCGDKKTLVSSNILIDNNILYNLSKWDAYGGGVTVDGETYSTTCVGVTVTHNTISRGDCSLGGGTGVDLKIAYNEMFDGVRNASDAAMVYAGRLFSEYDSRIEYNYIHDLGSIDTSGVYAVNGVFMDDLESGRYICNNIINVNNMNNTAGIKMGGGRDNIIRYNTIVGATRGLLLEDRTSNKADDYIFTAGQPYLFMQRDMTNGIDYHSSPWIDRHPGVSAMLNDIEADGKYLPKNNMITDNVIYKCETNQYPSHVVEHSTVENNTIAEEDIFVDSAKQDFRIKLSAKEKYNLSDKLIYEDFDLDQIGSSRMAVFEKDFKLLYPENEAKDIETRDMWISWEMQDYANEYYYIVAKDPELKNIVEEGRTLKTFAQLNNLENGQTYYWKVLAKNISRKQQGEWDSPSGVFSFTTAAENEIIKMPLGNIISSARQQLTKISEGNEIGKYKSGTKQLLNEEIGIASKTYNNINAKQSDIDAASNRLGNFVSTISQHMILGYQKLNIGNASEWIMQNSAADITVSGSDGAVDISRDSKAIGTVYRNEKYSTASILCLDINVEAYNGSWVGLSIKQTKPQSLPYTASETSSYLIVVKEGVIEFQRYNTDKKTGGIMTTIPNDVLKAGEWHSIQYGSVPCKDGTYIVFNVDGKEVMRFKDTEAPFYDDGYFTLLPNMGKISVRESENVPQENFTVPAEERIDKIYTSSDSVFTEVGNWNKFENSGYEESTAYSSSDPSSSLKWSMDEGRGIGKYRIYIWNDKKVNTDKNAVVKVTNYETDEKLTLDMTAQEDGWVDIGVYRFISAAVTSECMVELIPSGNGTLCASAIRIVKVNEE